MQDLGLCKVQVHAWAKPKLTPAANKSGAGKQILRIMKLTAIIILAACLQVSAKGYSQRITLSVKDAPLEQVFKSIEKQSGFYFNYVHEMIKKAQPVTIQVKDASLEEVLVTCFKGQPLDYTIVNGDKIVIIRERKQVVFRKVEKQDQKLPIDVNGKVTDESGAPLVGANVIEKGTHHGTTTNVEGVFVLKGVDGNGTLEISYIGYQTLTIAINNRTSIVISIKQDEASLQEVVINKGYYNEQKKFSTGNVTTIKATDIEKQPVNNPMLALAGRVPGLFITQANGLPGSAITVRIQGQNSIRQTGNDPLYIIDGIPYSSQFLPGLGGVLGTSGNSNANGSPLSLINPSDIESIEVLKDADATAIYGSRAANGAILITTKKGKAGKTSVDLNMQYGWAKVTRKMDLLNTRQYLDMRYEALNNDNKSPDPNSDYDLTFWDSTRYTDWQEKLIGNVAKYSDVQTTFSGGNANTQFLVSGTYHKETTVFPGAFSDQKASVRFSINNTSSSQRFRLQLSGMYLFDNNRLSGEDLTINAIRLAPDAPALYNDDGTLNWQINASGSSTWTNPLANLYNTYQTKSNNLLSNAILSYRILRNFDVKCNFGYTNLTSNEIQAYPLISSAPEFRSSTLRSGAYANNVINSWLLEPQFLYKLVIGKGQIDALIGASFLQNNSKGQKINGLGYNSDYVINDIKSAATLVAEGSTDLVYKYNAVFGRINYRLRDKYLVNFTGRRDGSSRFGSSNRFHNFGALGLAWIFSKENIFQRLEHFLSFGKIRGSYGTTGNDQIGDYQFLDLYAPVTPQVAYQGATGLVPRNLPNSYLQWEETKKIQLGIDLGFFNDRLLLSIDYNKNRSSNQLLGYALPRITGFTSITKNFPATVQNTGLEITVNSSNIVSKNFTWSSSINLTIPKNKLVSFPDLATSSYSTLLVIGQPLFPTKVFHFIGVDPSLGTYQFADSNGNATFSPNSQTDKKVLVNSFPEFYGGVQNKIRFKGFELDIFFQFVKQKGQNYNFGFIPGYNGINQPTTVLGRWQKAGDNTSIQKYNSNFSLYSQYSNAANFSDAAWSDASFVRLKTISLSWQLPEQINRRTRLRYSRVFIHGQNLLTITNFKGLDPENLSTSSLPPLRILTIGIQIGL
jgi:TonB-linked SusC/RagA family outer membrane protein